MVIRLVLVADEVEKLVDTSDLSPTPEDIGDSHCTAKDWRMVSLRSDENLWVLWCCHPPGAIENSLVHTTPFTIAKKTS